MRVKDLRKKVYGEEAIRDLSELSSIELELLGVVTGKSTHRFDGGRPDLGKIADDFTRACEAKEISEVPEGYKVESIEVPRVTIDFNPDTIRDNYEVLRKEIIQSVEKPDDINPLIRQSLALSDKKIASLKAQGSAKYLLDQISKIKALQKQIETVKDMDSLMKVLLKTKFIGKKNPFYSVMRQIVFRKIFIRNRSPEALADILARLSGVEISGQNVLEVIGIVDDMVKNHVLNLQENNKEKYWDQETWNVLHATRKSRKLINPLHIFSPHIGKLRETAKKFKLEETGEVATVRSIPDRGFVGEMSGYLADVCYTAEYPLLKPRPNLVPHKLVVGEEDEAEFFGSYLIFELEEDSGDKIMLVRGFNVPDEASIDIVKFIETSFDKLEATAQKRGMKKIVIPGLMGALSNYPLTKNYLFNRYVKEKESIKLKKKFDFNNYDLTESCFVVRTIE